MPVRSSRRLGLPVSGARLRPETASIYLFLIILYTVCKFHFQRLQRKSAVRSGESGSRRRKGSLVPARFGRFIGLRRMIGTAPAGAEKGMPESTRRRGRACRTFEIRIRIYIP